MVKKTGHFRDQEASYHMNVGDDACFIIRYDSKFVIEKIDILNR